MAGLRFTTRDPRALAAAVECLLADGPLRRSLIATAAAHVRSFDWDRASPATVDAYAEVWVPPGGIWATEGELTGPG